MCCPGHAVFRSVIPYVHLWSGDHIVACSPRPAKASWLRAAGQGDLRFIGQRSMTAGSRTVTNHEQAVRY